MSEAAPSTENRRTVDSDRNLQDCPVGEEHFLVHRFQHNEIMHFHCESKTSKKQLRNPKPETPGEEEQTDRASVEADVVMLDNFSSDIQNCSESSSQFRPANVH